VSSSKLVPPVAASLAVVSAAILMLAARPTALGIVLGLVAIACITALYFSCISGAGVKTQADSQRLTGILEDMAEGRQVDLSGLPAEFAEPLSRLGGKLEVLTDELDELSPHDRLTSLAKEEVFNNVLWREFNRSQRYEEPMSVALLRITEFEDIRREAGEDAADEVLKSVASVVLRMVRETDLAARYGDDRLAVIMPGTGRQGAREFAQRLQSELREGEAAGPQGPLQVAVGTASLPEEGTKTAPELVKKAAADLKAAGEGGSEDSE